MAEGPERMKPVGPASRLVVKHVERGSYLLIVVGALSILVAMWSALTSQVRYERQSAIDRAEFRNEGIAFAYEEFVLRTLKGADMLTRVMEAVLKYNTPEIAVRKLNESGIVDGEFFHSMGFTNANGDLIASTLGPEVPKLNYSDRDYFKEAASQAISELIVGVPVVSRITQRLEVPVVRRLSNEDGTFDGVIVVLVNPRAFTNVYRQFGIQGNDYIALIGLDGVARAAQVGARDLPGLHFVGTNVMEQQAHHASGSFKAPGIRDGIARYISYRTLPGYPLFVSTGTDEQEVLQDFNRRRDSYFFAGTISTFLIVMFAVILIMLVRIRDRTNAKLRSNETTLRELATHDSLTSLPNRTFLEARASEAIAAASLRKHEVACIFVDLDRFGAINEAFGHPVGDQVLSAVAAAIRSSLGIGHTAGRVGGDEFVIIAPAEDDAEKVALGVAATLRKELAKLHLIANKRVDIRASVGISRYPQDGDNLFDLIRCADTAMLQSKASRSAISCVFTAKMNREAEQRLKTQWELADALKREELEVFYQPQVSLLTQAAIGVEAVVRWRHPRRGLLPPGEFIPIAEESGLIVPLGEWVLNRACKDGKTLGREGYGSLPVSVNVSALQFRQPELVEWIARALDKSGLQPSCLELELTESMVADDPETIITRLNQLKNLGLRLALDDFGTGYSNLQYLRKFPLDVLKIDRSFVQDLPHDGHAASIAVAIVNLGRSLGLSIVAEGIETNSQQEFLASAGCHNAQGYLFGKAMPFDDLRLWLRAKNQRLRNVLSWKQLSQVSR